MSLHNQFFCRDGKIIVSGGINSDLVILNDFLVLNLAHNEWISSTNLLQPRADHVMLQLNSTEILIIGGWSYDQDNQRILIDTIDKFNHKQGKVISIENTCCSTTLNLGTWEIETRIPTPRFHCGVAIVNDKLHIVGGFHSDLTFDRATGKN